MVFDVDGTLYDQRRLRGRMMAELAGHCLRRPGDLGVLRLISEFRRSREELAAEEAEGIAELQYRRPAAKLGLETEAVRRRLEEWMLKRPLRHLREYRFPSVARFMEGLRASGRTIAVLSDYPAGDKLAALGLEADHLVAAVDPEVDRLKPHPRGLQRVLELAGAAAGEALLVGDRDDRDGECARRAGVVYVLKTSRAPATPADFSDYADLLDSLPRGAADKHTLE